MQSATALLLTLSLSAAVPAVAAGATPPAARPAAAPAPCVLPDGPLPTRTRAVFVLDTSGSMRGLGDGRADIFERVKAELNRYVRQTRPDRVELLTFDAGLRTRQGFDQPAGSAGWNAALAALQADGNNTYLYRSLRDALAPLRDGAQYASTVFVLTDGIDNDGVRPFTAAQALAAFGGRGPFDQLHYLALGTEIPADARQALEASPYADGLTVPLNRVPALDGPGLGSGLLRVRGLGPVAVPLADGTPVTVTARNARWGLRPDPALVTGGQVTFRARGSLPHGAAALLCAGTSPSPALASPAGGRVASKPQRVLLRLYTPSPLTLLNPGADLALRQGEDATLRYRAAPGVTLPGLKVTGVPAGLGVQVSRRPGAREFTVRFTNRGLSPGQTVRPRLALPGDTEVALPAVLGRAGGRTPYAAAATTPKPPVSRPPSGQAGPPQRPAGGGAADSRPDAAPMWLGGLAVLGLVGAGVWLFSQRRRAGRGAAAGTRPAGMAARRGRRPAPLRPLSHAVPPAVEGIEYSGGRVLSLVTAGGDVTGVPIPLGGPFDLGQLARVPHLSGLRAEQHRDGLQILRVPADLEVSQGTRLVGAGDVVRPGTLLGVAVGRAGRAPQPPLGSLAGLGLPLTLRHEAASVRAAGPYGQHTVALPAGPSDLGSAFSAPALSGLKVTLSGPNLLLVAVPPGLRLRRNGETAPLQPGSYLPDLTLVDLPDT